MQIIKNINFRKFMRKNVLTQLFINNNIKSSYTLTNFPSFFSPKTAHNVTFTIKIYAGSSKVVLEKKYTLLPFESKDVTFESYTDLPEIGIVSVEINPENIFCKNDAHLGNLYPQFYARYYNEQDGSLGLVHPQTPLNAKGHGMNWRSNLNIDTRYIKKVIAYQINPTKNVFENNLSLKASDGVLLEEKKYIFSPYSAIKNEFILNQDGLLHFELDTTTTPNAKPILFLYLDDETFTVVHS